jgi:predicted dehydrogenase
MAKNTEPGVEAVPQDGPVLHAGVIGCGSMAAVHIQACREAKLPIAFDAFCDLQEAQAARLMAMAGGRTSTTDPRRLGEDPTLQALYICTPNHVHLESLTAVASGGKAIFMEKPLVTRHEDFAAMAGLIERYRLRFFPGLKIRFNPLLERLRGLAPEVHTLHAHVIDGPWPAGHWTADPSRGGGHCLSQGIYATEGMRYLSGGEPVSVLARGGRRRSGPDGSIDTVAAVYEFDNGCVGTLMLADTAPAPDAGKFAITLCGTDISATLSQRYTRLAYRRAGDTGDSVLTDAESGVVEENRHFSECVLQGRPFRLSFRDGWICSEMVFAAFESMRLQQPVRIDPWRLNPGG